MKKHTKIVVKQIGDNPESLSLGNLQFSYYQKLGKLAHVGSIVTTNWEKMSSTLEVGGDLQYDEKTLLKGKINSLGKLGLALSRNISEHLTFSIATEIDTKEVYSTMLTEYKLGFRADLNF